jgi:MerR family transcriptional regulator/heat shock protein HspR
MRGAMLWPHRAEEVPMDRLPELARGATPAGPRLRTRAPKDVPRHSIGRAAAAAGLHPQTLRAYERRGLLRPERTDGGKRLFTDAEVQRAGRIRRLTDDGVTVPMARRVLRLEDSLQRAIDRIRVLEDQNARLSTRLQRLELARRTQDHR